MSIAMVELDGLRKEFPLRGRDNRKNGATFVAVDNVTCQIDQGEVFGLLGPNGAGKTTTIKMISTLLRPTSGTVKAGGIDVVLHPTQALRNIGTVLAGERSVYWKLTGRENLEYFAALYGIPKRLARPRINALLERFSLDKRADENVEKYSTGMRQRISLAKALLAEPQILILDEPTAGLDPQSARNLREIILEIRAEGRTVLLTTHYMEEADQLCDRIAIIDHGRIIALDTPGNLKRMLEDKRLFSIETQQWCEEWQHGLIELGARNVQASFDQSSRHHSITLHLNGGITSGDALTYLVNRGAGIVNFVGKDVSLEDVFIHLTGKSLRE
jgi:ABC-2 type transport system ATP-binding protein